jgi:MoxR-like ATPase
MSDWKIYQGTGPFNGRAPINWPEAPPWRVFDGLDKKRGLTYRPTDVEKEAVNAALYLRRPLLVTGSPGRGKSSLAYAVAEELGLSPVLRWSINSRSTLADALYQYDAIARLRDANLEDKGKVPPGTSNDIGRYLRLGPLGTALLPSPKPRVLLIDEIDKSDVDLPNDLLHVFEEGRFEIIELVRLAALPDAGPPAKTGAPSNKVVRVLPYDKTRDEDRIPIIEGRISATTFPFVLLTSNNERDLPPAFFRRCLRLNIPDPDKARLEKIVAAHMGMADPNKPDGRTELIERYLKKQNNGQLVATDQLLNALFLVTRGNIPVGPERDRMVDALLKELDRT